MRLDQHLHLTYPDKSRGFFQRLLEKGEITVNGKPAKPSLIVVEGQNIAINWPEVLDFPKAEKVALDIIFEDKNILVLNKPAGMIVHPNSTEEKGTLVQAILTYYPTITQAVYDPSAAISRLRPGIVHRLDKDTSGVIVVAKTLASLQNLAEQFKNHTVKKEYRAWVAGEVKEAQLIHTKMGRRISRPGLMGVRSLQEEGREAITTITPLEYVHDPVEITILSCQIQTGRTHQIRVHCKHLGHPVLGDPLYTTKTAQKIGEKLGINRQLLHAYQISFTHPTTGKVASFTAPLPSDMDPKSYPKLHFDRPTDS